MTAMVSLYPYQKSAVDLITTQRRVLIAYEMGLGKTPITITAMERLMEDGRIRDSVLVVVLSSLKYQWQSEIKKFAPDSRAVVVDGTPAQRDKVYVTIDEDMPDYVITTYDLIVRDYSWYAQHEWGAMVLDEMTAIKSFKAKRTKAIKALGARTHIRVGLTGTPITNGKAEEIFSLMEFVDPKVLGKFWDFDKRYIVRHPNGWITRYRHMDELNGRLLLHLARKRQMDPDVKDYLPEVLDMSPRLVAMDRNTARLYRLISSDLMLALDEAAELLGTNFSFNLAANYGQGQEKFDPVANALTGKIMQAYQALRMLCCHPSLLMDSALEYEKDEGTGSAYCWQLSQDPNVHLTGTNSSPKLDELMSYLKDAIEADPDVKVVVFTSWVRMFPYITEALRKAKIPHVTFHGGMSATQKDVAKTRFQEQEEIRVFLSSDAGGFGLDLPQASILINYDLPWSAGTAAQRNSRIIRASSLHKQVRIERLLVQGSVEERQAEMLGFKMSVAQGIVDGQVADAKGDIVNTVGGLKSFLVGEVA